MHLVLTLFALAGLAVYVTKTVGGIYALDLVGIGGSICFLAFLVRHHGVQTLKDAEELVDFIGRGCGKVKRRLAGWADRLSSSIESERGRAQPTQKPTRRTRRIANLRAETSIPWLAFILVGVSVTILVASSSSTSEKGRLGADRVDKPDKVPNYRNFSERWNDLPYECVGCGGPVLEPDDSRLAEEIIVPLPHPHPLLRTPRWYVPGIRR
jgi:hypothetical protein